MKLPRSTELIRAVLASPYGKIVACHRAEAKGDLTEFVRVRLDIQVPQYPVNDIRDEEDIGVVFSSSDDKYPLVYALRGDFPLVPHTNLTAAAEPRSLCLYSDPWSDIALTWTGEAFLESIREWLRLSALGRLHRQDQPLEPIIAVGSKVLIVPGEIVANSSNTGAHWIAFSDKQGFTKVLQVAALEVIQEANFAPDKSADLYAVTIVHAPPQQHGVIRNAPSDLKALAEMLASSIPSLLAVIRSDLKGLAQSKTNWEKRQMRWLLLLCLPKTRNKESLPETTEYIAFETSKSVGEVGVRVSAWGINDGKIGLLLEGNDNTPPQSALDECAKIELSALNVMFKLDRARTNRTSGIKVQGLKKICLIGAGALGSQVFMNLVRMGYGSWTVVDEDWLQPHNLARHALMPDAVGWPKSIPLTAIACSILNDANAAKPMICNAVRPSDTPEMINVCKAADLILDCSTSVAVARSLTHDVDSQAPRVSFFLNPSGTDLVMLAEDTKRMSCLDWLEMVYYRGVLNTAELETHLAREDGAVRYANSCRDLTSVIPQDFIALHAGMASMQCRGLERIRSATVAVWHCDPEAGDLRKWSFPVSEVIRLNRHRWTICLDAELLHRLSTRRSSVLPNETGGVLVGHYDMQRKIVYVVDSVLAPPDSTEYPFAFIRGHSGLPEEMARIRKITFGNLDYVGEWHSHPEGHGCEPSSDDAVLFGWLSHYLEPLGKPALMIIVGDNRKYGMFAESLTDDR
jgi:hypothetical protein